MLLPSEIAGGWLNFTMRCVGPGLKVLVYSRGVPIGTGDLTRAILPEGARPIDRRGQSVHRPSMTAKGAAALIEMLAPPLAETLAAIAEQVLEPGIAGGPTTLPVTGIAVTTGTFKAQRGTVGDTGLVDVPPSTGMMTGGATASAVLDVDMHTGGAALQVNPRTFGCDSSAFAKGADPQVAKPLPKMCRCDTWTHSHCPGTAVTGGTERLRDEKPPNSSVLIGVVVVAVNWQARGVP